MSAHHPELPTESGSDGYEITQLDDDPLDYGDIEAGIAAHLNVGDTLDAMIAAAVTERNTLRAQNEQMWKIIEKQRTIIQQVNEERAKDKEEVARLKSLLEAGSRSAEPADTPTPSPAPTPTPKPPKKQGVSFRMFTEEVVPNSKAEPSSSAARSSSPPPAAPISSILGLEPVKFDETDAKAKSSVIEDSEASTSKKVNVNRLSKARLSMRISEEDAKLYNMYFSAILDSDSSTLDLASSLFTPPPAKPADSDEPADPADEEPSEDESEEEVEDADTLTSAEPQNSFKFLAPVQVSTSVSSGRPVPDSPRTAPQPPQRMESRSNSESFAQPSVRSAERQSSVSIGAPYGSVRSEYDSGASQRANGLPFISTRSTSEPSLVISTSNGSPGSYPGGTGHLAPPLPPRELPSLEGCTFTVVSSRPLGDRTLAFVIHVQGHESWTIERGSSDFASLDMKIRSVSRNPHTKNMPALDRSIFTAYSTFKFDQRKNLIEQYLRRLHDYEKDAKDLVEFFTNGLSPSPARRESRTRHSQVGESQVLKEGYLHKKNKGLNSWKSRYFKCRVGVLELYDDQTGKDLVASIKLRHCILTRIPPGADPNYPNAFALVEYKSGSFTEADSVPPESKVFARHILAPASDVEREDWCRILSQQIFESRPLQSSAPNSRTPSMLSDATSPLVGSPHESVAYQRPNSLQPRQSFGTTWNPPHQPQLTPHNSPPGAYSSIASLSTSPSPFNQGYIGASPLMSANSFSSSYSSMSAPQPPAMAGSGVGGNSGDPLAALVAAASSSAGARQPTRNNADDHERALLQHPVPLPLVDLSWVHMQQAQQAALVAQQMLAGGAGGPHGGQPGQAGQGGHGGPGAGGSLSEDGQAPGMGRNLSVGGLRGAQSGVNKMVSNALNWGRKRNDPVRPTAITQSRAAFGLPLDQAVALTRISETLELPAIVYRCIDYLLVMKGVEEEGIYRLSGSSNTIQMLREKFNTEGDVDLVAGEPYDVHAVAGVLKLYLREIPVPILTQHLLRDFNAIIDLEDRNDRIRELATLMGKLPSPNYTLLRVLCSHLVEVVQRSEVNKMTVRNVGIVFSPTLGIPAPLFGLMLGEFDVVFATPHSGASISNGEGPSSL